MVPTVIKYPAKAQCSKAAAGPREAFGVRGACSRFRTAPRPATAPASWTHSKRFARQFLLRNLRRLRAYLNVLVPWHRSRPGACLLAITCAALVAAAHSVQAATVPAVPPAPLAYEMSAYELAPQFQPKDRPWRARDLKSAILKRVAVEKQRREMDVYYYRIGYTMGFPLPLTQRPSLKELPAALPGRAYPWLIWLSWDLAFSAGRAGFGSPTRAISNTGPATSATTRWEFRRTTRR